MKFIRRFFFWLSGCGTKNLEACPEWEQRKYVAFGATVLVPCSFAFIACAYALSTLTREPWISFGIAGVWSLIIMTIDRALLASYRPYLSLPRKIGQFSLRFVIAFLMGLTISHPLTLLLFRETIQGVIEKDRLAEVKSLETSAGARKKEVNEQLTAAGKEIAGLQAKLDETFSGSVPETWELNTRQAGTTLAEEDKAQADLEARIARAKSPMVDRLTKIDDEMKPLSEQFAKLNGELDYWQKDYEHEINGQRSGYFGVGPRARSLETDQLAWRRSEASRLSSLIEQLTSEKSRLAAESSNLSSGMLKDFTEKKAFDDERQKEERARLIELKKQMQEQQAKALITQLQQTRITLQSQMDAKVDEIRRLQSELAAITTETQKRVAAIDDASRKDILTQTLALHQLFRQGNGAGEFALYAYATLTLLFMLVDTIPLVIKFFTTAGPYDTLTNREEIWFDSEHKLFLDHHSRYVSGLRSGHLMSLTQDKELERSMIHGIEQSKVAKAFIESLIELEKAFQEQMRGEHAALAGRSAAEKESKQAMLESMATRFYADLHHRLENFFEQRKPGGQPSSV